MTDTRRDPTEVLAAEYVLGLIEGADLADAERRLANDPAFAAAVDRWRERLTPWFDDAPEREHSPELWEKISAALPPVSANDNAAGLRRSMSLWRGYAAVMTAATLALAALVTLRSPDVLPPTTIDAPAPMLVATLALPDAGAISLTVDHRTNRVVATAVGITPDGIHSHELWLVPARGAPQSLGVLDPAAPNIMPTAATLLAVLQSGATVAVSAEPLGGSRQAGPSGPVLTTAQLREI